MDPAQFSIPKRGSRRSVSSAWANSCLVAARSTVFGKGQSRPWRRPPADIVSPAGGSGVAKAEDAVKKSGAARLSDAARHKVKAAQEESDTAEKTSKDATRRTAHASALWPRHNDSSRWIATCHTLYPVAWN